jgi:UDP-N-acetylglucosamine--N-acetylmuramyl-(pentapeptide) pyrophosphoryl-undecaprenol N-acetylglucosamine transferase
MMILFSGGGTLGSVSPLLAVADRLRADGHQLAFVGTAGGPERAVVEAAGISFSSLTAPKLRRYFSFRHLLIPFELGFGLCQAARLLRRLKPAVIVSAGGFVSVPLVWVGRWRRIPAVVHQQDLEPGLANRLMAKAAARITVAFEESRAGFARFAEKVVWTGNPVRSLTPTTTTLSIDSAFPTVFVTGGGTGAQAINALVTPALCERANVIHLTGRGRAVHDFTHPRYLAREFLGAEMAEAFAKADLVVARAGLGTISELAALGKAAMIIPMPDSHQQRNADLLARHQAAVVVDQATLTPENFTAQVLALLADRGRRAALGQAIHALAQPDAGERFVQAIYDAQAGKR